MKKSLLLSLALAVSLLSQAQDYALQRIPVKPQKLDVRIQQRTLEEALLDNMNARYFGAGTGSDDTAPLRAYRNWCRQHQRDMVIPEGNYYVSDSIHVPGELLAVRGTGGATRIYFTNAAARCGWFYPPGSHKALMRDLWMETTFSGTSNFRAVEIPGGSYYLKFFNNTISRRNANAGANRGYWLNYSGTGNEIVWPTFTDCIVEGFAVNLDAGQGGAGNLTIQGGKYTQADSANIRIGTAGGAQVNTMVGGAKGKIGVHLLGTCNDIQLAIFSEVISAEHVAGIKIDNGAQRNTISMINGGNAPALLDLNVNSTNDVHITGTSQSVAGVAGPGNYRKMPFLELTHRSSANLFNGGLYLTNDHDSTAATGAWNQSVVFQSRVSAGGVINPTGAISSYRRFGGGNYGGIGIYVAEGGPLLVSRFDVFGQRLLSGDYEVWTASKGLILKSPNGTRYRVTVENDGTLTRTAL